MPTITTDGDLSLLTVRRVYRGNLALNVKPFPASELASKIGRIKGAAHIRVDVVYQGREGAEVWLDIG